MNKRHDHRYQRSAGLSLLLLAVPMLWWVSAPSRQVVVEPMHFIFLHSAVEIFAIIVSILVFITGYRAILSARKTAVVILGIAFLGVAFLDFLHTMSYVGMPDAITPNSSQKSIFFWLAARLLAASALFFYIALPKVPSISVVKKRVTLCVTLILMFAVAYVGIFKTNQIPGLFIPNYGLTPLKIYLELLVITINLTTLLILWLRRKKLLNECVMALTFAISLSAISELFFMLLGIQDKDAANVLGHLYKLSAYLYLFHATFNEALKRPLERLEIQHLREKMILSVSPDGILWIDQSGCILMANPAMHKLTGYNEHEMLGKKLSMFLPTHLRARHADAMKNYFNAPQSRAMGALNLALLCRDGQSLPVDISLGYWNDEGVVHAIAYIRDLTERKKFEDSLRHQATHDELTGLPNRTLLLDRLEQNMTMSERSGYYSALLLIDLDNFKSLNDTLGHDVGDLLIKQVANRLSLCLHDGDTVARFGGDEFVVILTGLSKNQMEAYSGTKIAAEKILTTLNQDYQLSERAHSSTASIGVTLFHGHSIGIESLIKQADIAMYRAKESGRNSIHFFDPTMETSLLERVSLEKDLRDAIPLAQFSLHYQAQIEYKQITGAEVLLRWQHPIRGAVAPIDFIPLAEENGLILPLGNWVLETACNQLAAWKNHPELGNLTLAVNVSSRQFKQVEFVGQVFNILQRTGANPRLLKLELTESLLVKDIDEVINKMLELRAVGIQFALDDFGTGYSSLSYLKRLPFDQLKIDKSFIRDLILNISDGAIVQSIIALANGLELNVIAEGVETEEQMNALSNAGCHTYQGYFFSRPLQLQEFENYYSQFQVMHLA